MKPLPRWGKLISKVVVPWLLATSSKIFQNDSPLTATQLANEFQSVYRRLDNSSQDFLVPPNLPTMKFSHLSSSSSLTDDSDDPSLPNKPLVLYLPGLDGYGISAFTNQFEDLRRTFDFWHLTIDRFDRSSFRDLMQAVTWFLETQQQQQQRDNTDSSLNIDTTITRQRIYLIGESFGGMLAPAVALQVKQRAAAAAAKTSKLTKQEYPVIIDGMVLVNPATSFSESSWDVVGPLLGLLDSTDASSSSSSASNESPLPSLYSLVGGTLLAATVPSNKQLQRLFQDVLLKIPRSTTDDWMDIGQGMKMSWDQLQYTLPGSTVQHRIREWLMVGDAIVTRQRLRSLDIPTLLVVGKDDRMLPSQAHAKELQNDIFSSSSSSSSSSLCETMVVKDGGHFVLDDRVNLTHAMIRSKVLDPLRLMRAAQEHQGPPARTYDPITDWKLPSPEDVQSIVQQGVVPLRKWFSPVFFSTDPKTGRRWKGLSKLPSLRQQQQPTQAPVENGVYQEDDPYTITGPVLIVANHQFAGFDLGLVISQLLEERNWTVRGLGHPVLFQLPNASDSGNTEVGWISPDSPDHNTNAVQQEEKINTTSPGALFSPSVMKKFGAVQVTPRNYYRLLQTGQNVLLFPGGVREVFHGRNEAYQIFWPEKPDFCRTAAKFNATIIPLCGIGMADTFEILLDSKDLTQLPFVGDLIRQQSSRVTAARFDTKQEEELFQPPLAFPKLPARNYFMFGRPISTRDISPTDRDACADLYQQVQEEMRQGLNDLVAAREHDPFQDTPQRLLYEQVTGKQAPTFPVEVLNRKRQH